uniref:Choline/carnitine acyltransferase domain-containing protein n=1 Tax=Parascaris univalens TaxID=6257 RepID=A0A915ATG6_PARUN
MLSCCCIISMFHHRVAKHACEHHDQCRISEREGQCPSEVAVLCRGNVWIIETMQNNEVLPPDVFLHQLKYIYEHSEVVRHSILSLTTLQRDQWADARIHLQSLSESNASNIARIERTIFAISLTDETFSHSDDVIKYGLTGDARAQWVDKSMNFFFHKDGRVGTQAEHSNVDAIVILDASDLSSKLSRKDIWRPQEMEHPKPIKIDFTMDASLESAVETGEKVFKEIGSTLIGKTLNFELFGNERFKFSKVYGDTIVQMALQLAFYRTHKKLAPAYETASTRRFFHGRTETVRSCTASLAKLVRLIIDDSAENAILQATFVEAYETHNQLMAEAMEGRGCDRYLYGVSKIIDQFNKERLSKIPRPEIFTDPAWKLCGGDGNFALSTSFVGYDVDGSYGYVAPMCEDGYGVFYKIGPDRIIMALSAFTTSKLTNLERMIANVHWSLEYLSQFFPITSRM